MAVSDALIGEIRIFPYSYIPESWSLCDGRTLPIALHQALFAVIGDRFGGDGRNSFKLPNLIGKVAIGTGASDPGLSTAYKINDTGGVANVSLTIAQMPSHTHQLQRKADIDPVNGKTAAPSAHSNLGALAIVTGPATTVNVSSLVPGVQPTTTLATGTIGTAGAGLTHGNEQPYLDLVYCICIDGEVFPAKPS